MTSEAKRSCSALVGGVGSSEEDGTSAAKAAPAIEVFCGTAEAVPLTGRPAWAGLVRSEPKASRMVSVRTMLPRDFDIFDSSKRSQPWAVIALGSQSLAH